MPEMTSYEHGVPSWIDIGTSDIAAAAEFYGGLFGWEAPEGSVETGGYRNAALKGKPVAGLGPQQNPGPPYWTTYFNVDSADAVAGKVATAGGTVVVAPMDVMEFGRMAIFSDPAGAFFGVWQPGLHKGAELVNETGTLSWNELITTDIDGAKAFYGEVLGLGAKTSEGGPFPYTEFQVGGRSVAGAMPKGPHLPAEVPPHWAVYFAVDDLATSVAKVKELGGAVMLERMDTPAGPFAAVADPQGGAFNIIQLAERDG